jgi:hypothetical protein
MTESPASPGRPFRPLHPPTCPTDQRSEEQSPNCSSSYPRGTFLDKDQKEKKTPFGARQHVYFRFPLPGPPPHTVTNQAREAHPGGTTSEAIHEISLALHFSPSAGFDLKI